MRSMTGYARATATVPAAAGGQDVREVCVEMRSVNNRYLDLSVRLPRSLTGLEERVRRALTAAGIARGKLDVTVTMTVRDASGEEGGATPLEPDMVFARRLADAAQRLSEGLGVPNDLTVSRLMAMPGVLVPVRPEAGESEEDAWGVLEPVLAVSGRAGTRGRAAGCGYAGQDSPDPYTGGRACRCVGGGCPYPAGAL